MSNVQIDLIRSENVLMLSVPYLQIVELPAPFQKKEKETGKFLKLKHYNKSAGFHSGPSALDRLHRFAFQLLHGF